MKLPKRFSQKDKRWAYSKIGRSVFLLRDYGCLITAFAMRLRALGWQTDPGMLNRYLTPRGAFNSQGSYFWGNIGKAYGLTEKIVDCRMRAVTNAELSEMKKKINSGVQVIIQVDYNSWSAPADMHFVIAEEVSGKDLTIIDPIDGERKSLLKVYGRNERWDLARAIYRIIYLEGEGKKPECNNQCPLHCKK